MSRVVFGEGICMRFCVRRVMYPWARTHKGDFIMDAVVDDLVMV